MRPLHHDCRPGTPRAPCGEKRSARVGEAPASRFRGGTHHRTVADGAMPTFSAASPEITPRPNPFCNRKNEILIHTKHAIFPSAEIGENQNLAHGFSGTMITD